MIQRIVQNQEMDNHDIDLLVLDHHRFHDYVKILVLDIVIIVKNLLGTEIYHVQDILFFINNEDILDLIIILPREIIVTVNFLDQILVVDSNLETAFLRIDIHQEKVQDLHVQPGNLSMRYSQSPLKMLITTPRTFQSQKTKLKFLYKPLKYKVLLLQKVVF